MLKMNLLFNLSGEHPLLPKAEIFATLEGEDIAYTISSENIQERIIIMEVETENPEFINRLAMTKKVGEFIGTSKNFEEIAQKIQKKLINGSFAIGNGSQSIRENLGKEIWKLGYGVDLLNPKSSILCFKDGKIGYDIAIETPLKRDFNERRPHKRPCFHPTSIDPKIARVLVNLARIKKGDTILDPFCGTGGILIEAALIGMITLGCDISEEMVEGCIKNMRNYNLDCKIIKCDAMNIDRIDDELDAIITDPPYGRSSYITDKNKERFYSEFITSAAKKLNTGKHLILTMSDSIKLDLNKEEFKQIEEYTIYVHKSLTRRIHVLKRI